MRGIVRRLHREIFECGDCIGAQLCEKHGAIYQELFGQKKLFEIGKGKMTKRKLEMRNYCECFSAK